MGVQIEFKQSAYLRLKSLPIHRITFLFLLQAYLQRQLVYASNMQLLAW